MDERCFSLHGNDVLQFSWPDLLVEPILRNSCTKTIILNAEMCFFFIKTRTERLLRKTLLKRLLLEDITCECQPNADKQTVNSK